MDENSKKTKLLEAGVELIGAAVGGAISLLGGPEGAIGGGMAGVVASKGLLEFSERFLSSRERTRVGATAGLVITGIQERLNMGQYLRTDGFFSHDQISRSKADELFEGVLLKCKNEHEEKKIRFLAKFYENIAFDKSVKSVHANQMLNTVQLLSYRQLEILAFIGQNEDNRCQVRKDDYDDSFIFTKNLQFLLQEFVALERQGLIQRSDHTAILSYSDICPGLMILSPIGIDLCYLTHLDDMPNIEFDFISMLK